MKGMVLFKFRKGSSSWWTIVSIVLAVTVLVVLLLLMPSLKDVGCKAIAKVFPAGC